MLAEASGFAYNSAWLWGTLGAAVLATAGSVTAAIITSRTRKENAEQHGASQMLIATLSDTVVDHGQRITKVETKVDGLPVAVAAEVVKMTQPKAVVVGKVDS